MNWTTSDYVIAGIVLGGATLLYVLICHFARTRKSKALAAVVVLILLVLIWAQLVVGLIDLVPVFTGS